MIILWILILSVSFYILSIVCNRYFTPSLQQIGQQWNLSSEATGATLMALGSSAPELSISLIALFKAGQHAELGTGNIVGSAIFQFLVIIGAVALVKEVRLNWKPFLRDMLFYTVAVVLLIFFLYDGTIQVHEPLIFLSVYITYLFFVIGSKKILGYKDPVKNPSEGKGPHSIIKEYTKNHAYIVFSVSVAAIGIVSWFLVESAINIAHITGIPEVIIAILIVAAGNSIPDLLSSVKAARETMPDMAVSNAVGSNNFDIMFGLGFPWLIALFITGKPIMVASENLFNTALILLGTVILTFIILIIKKWRLTKITGALLLGSYVIYIIIIIGSGLHWWTF
ncbi:calcium/sodium antiporter [Candidatus Peregrinibacteria bacterium]|nr:calcium/sodium antiporter [Candidatus Peregrinibacteria bacterium]